MESNEVKENGESCSCGGSIDRLYSIKHNPSIWRGRCFQCQRPYNILFTNRLDDHGQIRSKI